MAYQTYGVPISDMAGMSSLNIRYLGATRNLSEWGAKIVGPLGPAITMQSNRISRVEVLMCPIGSLAGATIDCNDIRH